MKVNHGIVEILKPGNGRNAIFMNKSKQMKEILIPMN